MRLRSVARKIFLDALESVKPEKLVTNVLHRDGDWLILGERKYLMKKNVYVVGFGKAVYGMAVGVEKILNDHIVGGYLSVPHGFTSCSGSLDSSKIKIVPAAENNLPDTVAMQNALNIKSIVDTLTPNDIALVLISGGGSALLPLPVPQISLEEKLESIKIVANAGGSIQQLNTMRKKLSQLKGGGLLSSCCSSHLSSLIISDIVGDPLDLIASGPTEKDESTVSDCLKILHDLDVEKKLPLNVMDYLRSIEYEDDKIDERNAIQCDNIIVGSNKTLVECVEDLAFEHGFIPHAITRNLEGDAEEVGRNLAEIATLILASNNREKLISKMEDIDNNCFDNINDKHLLDVCLRGKRICIICAGETTVHVKGSGRGGRNQHIILSAMKSFQEFMKNDPTFDFNQICLLSGGTDGQDGATDVAGALCDGFALRESIEQGLDVQGYLNNCGSHDFFSEYSSLDGLIKTGLTGTNVMDVQILLIERGEVE